MLTCPVLHFFLYFCRRKALHKQSLENVILCRFYSRIFHGSISLLLFFDVSYVTQHVLWTFFLRLSCWQSSCKFTTRARLKQAESTSSTPVARKDAVRVTRPYVIWCRFYLMRGICEILWFITRFVCRWFGKGGYKDVRTGHVVISWTWNMFKM